MPIEKENLAAEILCECTGTTRGSIFDLASQGLDFEAISRKTGVNTGCGGCEWEVEAFIEALQKK
jgi:bacterioferritin-associated ferredoxin